MVMMYCRSKSRVSTLDPCWKSFLSRYGATIDHGAVMDFGHPLAERRAASGAGVICDLSHHGLIVVEGEDTFTFLQGQLTCDLSQVTQSCSRLAAWCSPKGRVLALFRVFRSGNGILLQLPAPQLETTMARLRMYVLRARVSLGDVSDEFVRIGLCGDSATGVIENLLGSAPSAPDEMIPFGDSRVVRLHGNVPRYQFIGERTAAQELWRAAAEKLRPAGQQVWSLLEILAGVPEITQGNAHLPQMLNLDVLGGLSFEKGCYVGQEIIARTHHLGTLKRRMRLIDGRAPECPSPGTPVVDATAGSEAGEIVSSAPRGERDEFAALTVLRIDAAKTGALRLGSTDGPRLALLDLPYSVGDKNG